MLSKTSLIAQIATKFKALQPFLNERSRRIWAATEARVLGHGGQHIVSRAIGMHVNTIWAGMKEITHIAQEVALEVGFAEGSSAWAESEIPAPAPWEASWKKPIKIRIRKLWWGRKALVTQDPTLLTDLQNLIEPATRGDPENPLLWCSKSTYKLADTLNKDTKRVSATSVGHMLRHTLWFTLQANSKTLKEGADHPDRDAQFHHINATVKQFQSQHSPVISIDCKKKENIGNFKNNGKEYHKKWEPEQVLDHDFMNPENGKVAPYGILDLTKNAGWVNVGISADTATFAVHTIRTWWKEMWQSLYPEAQELLMTADCWGSNSYRSRLWKLELQTLATELGLTIHVCHFPPGTSKWNKIEHKLFSFISKNWRNTPLRDHATVINLISKTTTKAWLTVKAYLDKTHYETGIKVSDEDLANIALVKNDFHGEWNYKILPRKS
jgi:Rhodopirellula transposase DDE domain